MPRHSLRAYFSLTDKIGRISALVVLKRCPSRCTCQRANRLRGGNRRRQRAPGLLKIVFLTSGPTGMVGVPGVEPGTLSLSGTRSNQLSYTPL